MHLLIKKERRCSYILFSVDNVFSSLAGGSIDYTTAVQLNGRGIRHWSLHLFSLVYRLCPPFVFYRQQKGNIKSKGRRNGNTIRLVPHVQRLRMREAQRMQRIVKEIMKQPPGERTETETGEVREDRG